MRRRAWWFSLLAAAAVPAAALSPVYPVPLPILTPAGAAAAAAPAGLASLATAALPLSLPVSPIATAPAALGPAPAARPGFGALPLLRRLAQALSGPAALPASSTLGTFWSADRVRGAVDAPQLPPYLAVAKAADREFVARAVEAARESPSGRTVLGRMEAALARRGPVRVVVRDLKGNWGQYDYVRDVLEIHSRFLGDPVLAAPTMVHELLHILQHAEEVPAEALEMELEAHIVTLRVMEELGVHAESDTFSAEAARRLALAPEEYVRWMEEQLPGKLRLRGSDFAALREQLEDEVSELEERLGSRPSKAAQARLDWVRRDLALLRSASGRRRYRAFADRVASLIKEEHRRRAAH